MLLINYLSSTSPCVSGFVAFTDLELLTLILLQVLRCLLGFLEVPSPRLMSKQFPFHSSEMVPPLLLVKEGASMQPVTAVSTSNITGDNSYNYK